MKVEKLENILMNSNGECMIPNPGLGMSGFSFWTSVFSVLKCAAIHLHVLNDLIIGLTFRGFSTEKPSTISKKEFVAAFRESFSRLGELRSLLNQKPLVPVLALTATANLQTRKAIEESLCLRKSCVKIFLIPNRENIYINKLKVNSYISESFRWLVDKIRQEKVFMDKTIVYCKSIKDCGRLFTHFKLQLGKDSYYILIVKHQEII